MVPPGLATQDPDREIGKSGHREIGYIEKSDHPDIDFQLPNYPFTKSRKPLSS
jgi:hypothetical protein